MASRNTPEIIPAIDLLAGRCVRLYQGDFEQVTQYQHDPRDLAVRYRDAGLATLHVVDLDGARTGQPTNMPVIGALAETAVTIQAGGGIRDRDRLRQLLDTGVSRAVIGSVAVQTPEVVAEWLEEVGPDRMVLAFDVRLGPTGEPMVLTHGWTRDSQVGLWSLVDYFLAHGARRFLCTDVRRDGTLTGPNTELYARCTARYPEAEFLASGGVSGPADLAALRGAGVAGIITGKALLDGRLTLKEIEKFSRDE